MNPSLHGGISEQLSHPKLKDCENGVTNDEYDTSVAQPIPANVIEYKGLRKVIRNFTPSWFAVIMGTGIVSILLHNLPYNGRWIYCISVAFFALNVFLFIMFSFLSVARYAMYPEIWGVMIRHPAQSLFLGTFPMGLATIVNMVVYVCVPAWGSRAITLAWALWWIDAVIAVAVCFWMPFVLMTLQEHKMATMTAAWLLPIVSTIVASSSGGVVASILPNPQHALWTIVVSYVLWGTGMPLAMAILVIYFQRLTIYHLPPKEVIVSVFLPLGPLGQGGFGIMQLGAVAMKTFPLTGCLTPNAGEIFYVAGFLMALIMWGFGLLWLFFAISSIEQSRFPFSMGWWGFIFPLGVFAAATTKLGTELTSRFFDVVGTIFTVVVVILWIVVALRTVQKSLTGEIFHAPCLQDLKPKETPVENDKNV